jgi:hypothetical protein
MTTPTLREAAQQALEALIHAQSIAGSDQWNRETSAITALSAALAEPDHKDRLIAQLEETNLWQAKRIAELLAEPQEPVQVPEGYKLVPVSALQWLFGEAGEFECPPERYFRGKSPTYWWRSVFRGLIEAAPVRAEVLEEAAGVIEDWDTDSLDPREGAAAIRALAKEKT